MALVAKSFQVCHTAKLALFRYRRSSAHGARASTHSSSSAQVKHSPEPEGEAPKAAPYGRTHSEVFRLFEGTHFGLSHLFKELQFNGACVQAISELHVLTIQLVDLRVRPHLRSV